MAQIKTTPTKKDVKKFLSEINNEQQQQDAQKLVEIMQDMTGDPAVIWGSNIIGFGDIHLTYASGREVDWFKIGFAVRRGKISLYPYLTQGLC